MALHAPTGRWQLGLTLALLTAALWATLPVALNRLVSAYGADWGAFAAGSILVSLPVCALFFALQKQLVAGLTSGAVK